MTMCGLWLVFAVKCLITMIESEPPIDPKVQEAADRYRGSLEELQGVQDPLSKKALRQEALRELERAVIITTASELTKKLLIKPVSQN